MSSALDFCVFVYGYTMSSISMSSPGRARKDDDDDGRASDLGFTLRSIASAFSPPANV